MTCEKSFSTRNGSRSSPFPFYAPNPVKSQTDVCCGGDDPSRLILSVVDS